MNLDPHMNPLIGDYLLGQRGNLSDPRATAMHALASSWRNKVALGSESYMVSRVKDIVILNNNHKLTYKIHPYDLGL